MQPEGEPPLMESAACAIDLLQGRENIEFPRILSALCWIVGALPVFFISRRLLSAEAALVAVALYLFSQAVQSIAQTPSERSRHFSIPHPYRDVGFPPQRQSCAAIVFPFDIPLFLKHKVSMIHISALLRQFRESDNVRTL